MHTKCTAFYTQVKLGLDTNGKLCKDANTKAA